MNRLETDEIPVIGQDGWVEFIDEIPYADDFPVMIHCEDGSIQQGHAIEFRSGYLRGGKIICYKAVEDSA